MCLCSIAALAVDLVLVLHNVVIDVVMIRVHTSQTLLQPAPPLALPTYFLDVKLINYNDKERKETTSSSNFMENMQFCACP
jgi:hypothetical protein